MSDKITIEVDCEQAKVSIDANLDISIGKHPIEDSKSYLIGLIVGPMIMELMQFSKEQLNEKLKDE